MDNNGTAAPASSAKFNYTPVENTTGKEIRIAAICVQNNPFWVDVKSGIDAVTTTLTDSKYNCTVDFISMDTFDAQKFKEAIDTCIVKGYDAITTVGVSDAIVATKDFITANPDLSGIYVTAGGPHGTAKALEELGLTDKVSLVCFDFTAENLEYVRKGAIKATIDQDPFGQGADPIILAYNEKVTGKPEVTGKAFTKMDTATPENVDTLVSAK